MSNTLTPSGLQSSAGLYGSCGVYQFDRNGAIFNPLDLNPYLLFDAESSMIGTLENPTLDLDPTKQESLEVITATRAGTATFVNLDGEIEIAQPDTVRVDSSLGYPAILVEPSATNNVTNTDFSTWANSSSNDSVGSAAPYGNFTKIKPSGNSSDAGVYKFISLASGALTQSCYAKFAGKHLAVLSAGKWTGYFNLQSGTATGTGASIQPVGNGVFRCSVTGTDSSSSTHAIKFLVVDAVGSNAVTETGVDGVEIAMPQVEEGAVATSFIPTSGGDAAARTRAADSLVISGSAFSSFYNQSEGTIYAEFVPKLESLDATLFNFSDGSNFNRIMSLTKFYHIFVTTSGNTQVQFASGSVSLNNLNRLAASFKTNDCVLSLNGSSEVVDSSMAMPSINQINIGARFGGTEHLQGHIRRLLYWPVSSDSL